ncbi:MAG: hypothetical protein PHU06_13440 [Gallionella sp.]|nr:hypothetical protein [Gallionella sp.]MDD4959904.1 hypothetical protein [Gallionella sp.]
MVSIASRVSLLKRIITATPIGYRSWLAIGTVSSTDNADDHPVQYINRSDRRTGSLWEGNFKSSLVQVEAYLLNCMDYIELNPVRANRVNDPSQYCPFVGEANFHAR